MDQFVFLSRVQPAAVCARSCVSEDLAAGCSCVRFAVRLKETQKRTDIRIR